MSYQEIDGKEVLTISQSDYFRLLTALGIATGALSPKHRARVVELLDRINEGNPDYRRYMNPRDQ